MKTPPARPPEEQSIHTTRLHVQPDDMIRGFHVHYSVYLRYLEAAAVEHMDALGATTNELLARYQAGFVVRHADIEYLAPAMSGDDLDVRTWIESVQGVRLTRWTDIYNAGTGHKLLVARVEWIWCDTTHRPRRIPAGVHARLLPTPIASSSATP